MLKRHEVEILLKAGHRKTEVVRLTGVSLCSVKRIAQEGPVVHVDDAAERAQRQVGRPSTVTNFRKPVLEILQHTPDLASLEILRRVRETGYEGGKTALYALVASLRPHSAVIATNVDRRLIILSLLVCGVSLKCGLPADKSPAKLQREHGQSLCHGVQPPV